MSVLVVEDLTIRLPLGADAASRAGAPYWVIHRADLQPLDNLELFGMAPLLTLESYRAIGRNAGAYALGEQASPVPIEIDNFARAKLIVKTTLLHAAEAKGGSKAGAKASTNGAAKGRKIPAKKKVAARR